ncbi:hypothetical protein COLO4_12290 [Corchorus olitorius]|uniref:Uncharacterized protein n=1 Tax=Corchorus olitorius TaxID=93759 RepID=A0A1R3K1C6_9ROSI|nr:hypothetical protein COLO4_12290 [Corchorus olitorius]
MPMPNLRWYAKVLEKRSGTISSLGCPQALVKSGLLLAPILCIWGIIGYLIPRRISKAKKSIALFGAVTPLVEGTDAGDRLVADLVVDP